MKILVTGGAGFIGSNLAQRLLAEGHQVTVLDNLQSGYRINLDVLPGARFIEGDVRNQETVIEAAEGAKVVFHPGCVGRQQALDRYAAGRCADQCAGDFECSGDGAAG